MNHDKAIRVIKDLGPAPTRTKNVKGMWNWTKITNSGSNIYEMQELLSPKKPVYEDADLIDITGQMDRARFLYQGPDSKDGQAVFYVIVNRYSQLLYY